MIFLSSIYLIRIRNLNFESEISKLIFDFFKYVWYNVIQILNDGYSINIFWKSDMKYFDEGLREKYVCVSICIKEIPQKLHA